MSKNWITQWHESWIVSEWWSRVFVKHYQPWSYEIQNEANWLTSTILANASTFSVPQLREVSINGWYIKMDALDHTDGPLDSKIQQILEISVELHGMLQSDRPYLRTKWISITDYLPYLERFTQERLKMIPEEYWLNISIWNWIIWNIRKLKVGKFSIVHRDLRIRHLLLSWHNKPHLIDWEFSNISEPAQDLAKLIFDLVVNHWQDYSTAFERVLLFYSNKAWISQELLRERILVFLPIIPLEHIASFLSRKPEGFDAEVKKDINFIKQVYDKEKN